MTSVELADSGGITFNANEIHNNVRVGVYYRDPNLLSNDPIILLQQCVDRVEGFDVLEGTKNSIISTLYNAMRNLAADNGLAARNQLEALSNRIRAQSGKHLSREEAQYIVGLLTRVIAAI